MTRASWHCVTDHTTWPGCGRCGPCREAAPAMFDRLRSVAAVVEHSSKVTPSSRATVYRSEIEEALS